MSHKKPEARYVYIFVALSIVFFKYLYMKTVINKKMIIKQKVFRQLLKFTSLSHLAMPYFHVNSDANMNINI